MASYPYIPAKSISKGGARAVSSVKYIVIHYTGNVGDTAKNNADFFGVGGSNPRVAGAHFFVDQSGSVYQSIPVDITAWSVGGFFTSANGAAAYYQRCTCFNSVSIEMCDCATKDPSSAMVSAMRELVRFIQSKCPNAKTIIRHWDVSGKECPKRLIGTNNPKWNSLKTSLTASSSGGTTAKPIFYGYAKKDLNIYTNRPNWKDTGRDIKKDSLVYCYATWNEKKLHYDGEDVWVWWAINPEKTEWVVYTNRITRNKVFFEGTALQNLNVYDKPKPPQKKVGGIKKGTEVKCYGTMNDKTPHSDGQPEWVWWRITPLLDSPKWVVYTKRIKKKERQ